MLNELNWVSIKIGLNNSKKSNVPKTTIKIDEILEEVKVYNVGRLKKLEINQTDTKVGRNLIKVETYINMFKVQRIDIWLWNMEIILFTR